MSKNFVVCPLCNNKFKSLMSHIVKIHKVSINEVKKEYPNIQLVSQNSKKKTSITCKKIGCGKWRKGSKMSDKWKKEASKRNKGKGNPFFGKKHTNKTKAKMRKNHADFTGDKNPFNAWAKNPKNKEGWLNALLKSHKDRRDRCDDKYIKICEDISQRVAKLHIEGKLVSYGRGHKNGYFISKRQRAKIYFRSSYEERFLQICENSNEIKFGACKFYIPYITLGGTTHNYIPDFILNDKVVIEIKPKRMLYYGDNKLKHIAGEKYCESKGFKYLILTEEELQILEEDKQCLLDILIMIE